MSQDGSNSAWLMQMGISLAAVTAQIPTGPRRRAIYASGSFTDGWSHASSDVDLYVIGDVPSELGSDLAWNEVDTGIGRVPIFLTFVAGVRWDIEYWTDEQVSAALERVQPGQPPQPLARPLIDFLYRLSTGTALDGAGWLMETKAALAASEFRTRATQGYLEAADSSLDDAVGLVESGDFESAVLSARAGFGAVVDGLLASIGELNPSYKWRARKMARGKPSLLSWRDYWDVETMIDYAPAAPGTWVLRIVELCRTLMLEIET